MVSFYLYILLSLTDFNTENEKRALCGWILVITILLSSLVNFIKFFYMIGKGLYELCRKKRLEKRRKEYLERQKELEEFKKQSKTLELQEYNPYAYSLERPHTSLIEVKTRNTSVSSTLNLLGSVPFYVPNQKPLEAVSE